MISTYCTPYCTMSRVCSEIRALPSPCHPLQAQTSSQHAQHHVPCFLGTPQPTGPWHYRGEGNFEVSQLRVGKFAFQNGYEFSHAKSRGLCEISRTLAADTVDSCVPLSKFKRQVKFAVVNFAVGNFAETPGFRVVNFTDTARNVVVRRALRIW